MIVTAIFQKEHPVKSNNAALDGSPLSHSETIIDIIQSALIISLTASILLPIL